MFFILAIHEVLCLQYSQYTKGLCTLIMVCTFIQPFTHKVGWLHINYPVCT